MRKVIMLSLAVMAAVMSSCSEEERDISGIVAEMCMMPTNEGGVISYVVTDDNRNLSLQSPIKVAWAQKADTTYRALLYYRNVEGNIMPYSAQQVLLLKPKKEEQLKEMADAADPLALVSAWYAKNGKFLNLAIDVKTGEKEGDDKRHVLALLKDTVFSSHEGKKYCYRILHSRNGMPEYYTVRTYFSIPVEDIAEGDTLQLQIPEKSGMLIKDLKKVGQDN